MQWGNTEQESRETVPCPSDDHRTLISDSLFADLTPPAQCFWTLNCDGLRVCGNDGLGKTRQCNSEFSNTLHKNWLHDKFCFVLCSNKTKSLLTILTITQRITDYKTSLLGGKMEYSIVFKPQLFSFLPSLCSTITVINKVHYPIS